MVILWTLRRRPETATLMVIDETMQAYISYPPRDEQRLQLSGQEVNTDRLLAAR
jgi:hypothetical protein